MENEKRTLPKAEIKVSIHSVDDRDIKQIIKEVLISKARCI